MNYIAISTVRNEVKFIDHTIQSVLKQSVKPSLYLVVDDGSTDGTTNKLDLFKKKNINFEYIKLNNKRYFLSGYHQSIAFKTGVDYASKFVDWDFLFKIDADSKLPYNYVENLIEKTEKDPKIGICGGQPRNEDIRLSRVTDAARLIKRECWNDIKGYDNIVSFDSHAVIKAKQLGYKTRTFKEIKFTELRSSKKYTLKRWFQTGIERKQCYFPLYHTILASLKNIKSGYPPIINSLVVILTHILYQPKTHFPFLKKETIKKIAIQEIKEYFNEAIGRHPQYS